jgi:hypothetical protein
VSRIPVTIDTFQAFLAMHPVVESYDFLFDAITQFQHLFVTVQAPLRGEGIVGQIFGREKMIGMAFKA